MALVEYQIKTRKPLFFRPASMPRGATWDLRARGAGLAGSPTFQGTDWKRYRVPSLLKGKTLTRQERPL